MIRSKDKYKGLGFECMGRVSRLGPHELNILSLGTQEAAGSVWEHELGFRGAMTGTMTGTVTRAATGAIGDT
jgi:hypothetical protein